MSRIREIWGREILDSRGNPTIETEVILESGSWGKASVPSGASTGKFEALELRDGDKDRYYGKGVKKAVENINDNIAYELEGLNPLWQNEIDKKLIEIDGTDDKRKLGANAILSVSLASSRATANELGLPLFKYIGGIRPQKLPIPLMNLLNGGEHANNNLDMQEFMIVPWGAGKLSRAIQMGSEIFHQLQKILNEKSMSTSVGDEGGFAPDLDHEEQALELLLQAVEEAGYSPGEDISFALDPAASEFYENGNYHLGNESLDSDEMVQVYEKWVNRFPIISIEDGLDQQDWDGWVTLTDKLGEKIQIVGDDLFVTNTKRLRKGIEMGAANSILIKTNQIGTLTETIEAVEMAQKAGYSAIISHRSGETEDSFIADLATGLPTSQIKSGSLSRSDRLAKYNELLRIEDEYGLDYCDWPKK